MKNKGFAMLEAIFTIPTLLFLLLFIVGMFIRQYTVRNVDLYTEYIARTLVVCESMEDAETKAEDLIDQMELSYLSELEVSIDYLPGSQTTWRKGNYIQIVFHGKLNSVLLFGEKDYDTMITKMIEKNGEISLEAN